MTSQLGYVVLMRMHKCRDSTFATIGPGEQ